MDCFAFAGNDELEPWKHVCPRGAMRPGRCFSFAPSHKEGRGESRVPIAPAVVRTKTHE